MEEGGEVWRRRMGERKGSGYFDLVEYGVEGG